MDFYEGVRKMLKIAICDDDYIYIEQIKALVTDIFTNAAVLFSITSFSSGEKLYQDLQNGITYDIALLDIKMDRMSGIDVGDKLRKHFQNNKTILIYISSYDNRAKEVFQFNTHRFLSKPIEYHLFEEALLSANQIWKEHQSLNFSFRDTKLGNVKVPLKDILYIENNSRNHHVDVTTTDHTYILYDVKLSDIHKNLSSFDFILIHHSTLVNFDHIRSLSYDKVDMSDGKTLSISGPKRKYARALFYEIRKRQEKNIWL